jgi:deoxyribodipyrimidine photo-lyase
MAITKIEDTRVRTLNDLPPRENGDYVLYWMQQSQRAEHNPALEHAARRANQQGKPLLVGFGLTDDYPEANARHYRFMLEGLAEVKPALESRGIRFVLRRGAPDAVAIELARNALLVVCDRGYLRHQKTWRRALAEKAGCRVEQVEGDVIVPVDKASDKREYAARTLRPKLHCHLGEYLVDLNSTAVEHSATRLSIGGEDPSDPAALLARLRVDRSVAPVDHFRGGTGEAKRIFRRFLDRRFSLYQANRNQPQTDDVSHMSKYLHFGQISPVWLALRVREAVPESNENRAAFIEELVVRRELAINFCEFEPDYDSFSCLPEWVRTTLAEHRDDRRPHHYTRAQLEAAETHDPYWNSAMREMVYTGYMHNYMRMYWGKKILEWTRTPEYAFRTTLDLNNKYFLDGRDPNSFAGVAWIFGNHDRGWTERKVFGKVRYMNAAGLERKCDIQGYVEKVTVRTGSTVQTG